ncbi:hypothetical protein [Streptomyces werraensis]|uniref:hypothetical protein n=1 Tax=Streptomyces werraensis TaxID=68284 RepID=UPI001CE2DD3C
MGQGCVAGVDQVLGGKQPAAGQAGVDAGQDLLSWVVVAVVATSVITLGPSGAQVSVRSAANPFQLMMCLCRA